MVDSPGVVTDTEDTDKVAATCFRRDPGEEVLDLRLVVLVCPVLPLLPGPGLGLELDPVPREERHRLVAAAGVSVPPVRSPAVPGSHVVVRVLGQEVGAGQERLGLTLHMSHSPGPQVLLSPGQALQLHTLLYIGVSEDSGPGSGLQVQLGHVGVEVSPALWSLPDVLLPVLRVGAQVARAQGGRRAAGVRPSTAVLAVHLDLLRGRGWRGSRRRRRRTITS